MNLRNKLTLANANPNESTPLSRAIFFIIIGVAFYLLDRFSFFAVDDYMYAYKYSSFDRIDNLRDIIMSQCEHYMNHNGRFVVHCVVQIFCGILGISAFQYINTLFFIGFCGITTRLVFNTWNVSIVKYSLVAFVVFFLGPRIEYNILGSVAYCINYLWVSVLIGLFLILFHKTATNSEAKSLSYFHKSLIFVYSVLVGSLQESFSVPLCCSLLIYYLYIRKIDNTIFLSIGFWLGSAILIFAPGNFNRLTEEVVYNQYLKYSIRHIITIVEFCLPYLILILVGLLCCKKDKLYRFIVATWWYWATICLATIFYTLIALTGTHQLFFICWLLLILLIKLINEVFYIEKHRFSISFILCVVTFPFYLLVYEARAELYYNRQAIIDRIVQENTSYVPIYDYYAAGYSKTYIGKKYTMLSRWDHWYKYLSHYYTNNTQTIKSFVPCREGELLSFLQNNKNISENVWYMPEYDCYVIEYDDNKHSNIMVSYEITGLNALLKRIKGEDIVVQSVLTEAQKNYYIKHNSLVYIFLFRTLEGPIQSVWLK